MKEELYNLIREFNLHLIEAKQGRYDQARECEENADVSDLEFTFENFFNWLQGE